MHLQSHPTYSREASPYTYSIVYVLVPREVTIVLL